MRKAASTAQNIASEHPARENPASREGVIATSLLWELAASEGPRGVYIADKLRAVIKLQISASKSFVHTPVSTL